MRERFLCAALLAVCAVAAAAAANDAPTLLLRQPTLSDDHVAFVYAGDLWLTDRDGRDARRLTSDPAEARRPHFSPDGRWIAFTAEYGGNTDVYVIAAAGGEARRLTYHPGNDEVSGWSSDGSQVAFASAREVGNGRSGQLYHVGLDGGLPAKIMQAPFFRGAWHGAEIAYMAYAPAYNGLYGGSAGWRGYRGGTTPFIGIIDPATGSYERVPGARVNDIEPMWDGDTLYFISDRNDKVFNVFAYDRDQRRVRQLSAESVWDVRSADAHGGRIVYEAGGRLKELDPLSGSVRELDIALNADLPATRPRWVDASRTIESVSLSPTGKRALITARGDVFTVPTEHGSTRNLTTSDGVREYTALWSPDGARVAYVVDDHGEQFLAVRDQQGLEAPRRYGLPGDYHRLRAWAGDGDHLVYEDNHLTLHSVDLESGRSREIATQTYRSEPAVDISPDGQWVAFTLSRDNLLSDLMLYEVASGTSTRLSDGMADVGDVAFSPDGAYLYFTASTNTGQTRVGLDLSSRERPRRLAMYGVVLAADGKSPLAPRTGDETVNGDEETAVEEQEDDTAADAPEPTRVDLQGIASRIVALPLAERNYSHLQVAEDGDLLFIDRLQPGAVTVPAEMAEEADNTLKRFDFEEREVTELADGITALVLSRDGKYLLVRDAKSAWSGSALGDELKLEKLDTSGMRMRIDPRLEWAQIFHDTWRMEQVFFYAENMHGLDWQAVYDRYRPLLDHAGRREDVNDLMVQMIAELHVGHNRVGGGDVYRPDGEAPTGLLGADLRVENGRYRLHRIYDGERWNPFLHAPLARPELGIEAGDYLLAVNGRELTGADNLHQLLQGTVGKQITLSVGPTPDPDDARNVVVEPADSERLLRLWDWVEKKRRRVEEASDGRVGYVYLPDTAGGGYTFFNRMFFAQVDKQALIVDERSNSGGQAANYVVDVLARTYLASWKDREGGVFDTPGGAVYGPKVMLIDQDAGSGGDFLPYAFRHMGLGKLIGTRTWGGLIGIAANPPLMDGGGLVVPYFRFFTPDGEWAIENEGVAPDIEVPLDPVAFNRGEDVQLERAIDEVLSALEDYEPVKQRQAPPLPTRLGQ